MFSIKELPIRIRRITSALDLSGDGLEYGPLHNPIVPPRAKNIRYADFTDRKSLVTHYKSDKNVNTDNIPNIDIVTEGKLISKFIKKNSLDYIVASHVMEHVPDMIGWIEANLIVLKKGGRLALALPDKRFSFDMLRRSTLFSDLIAAYYAKATQPTLTQVADHFMNVVEVNPIPVWNGKVTKETVQKKRNTTEAIQIINHAANSEYTDCHCWVFTDQEFLQLMEEIKEYLDIDFEVISFFSTLKNTFEFYCTIEKV